MSTQAPTVLVTGCTTGSIGHYLALEFLAKGYHVFATSRRISSMSLPTENSLMTLLELDVTSKESIDKAYTYIKETTGGHLDILYNNAGVRALGLAVHSDEQMASYIMNTNFVAVVEMTRVFSDLLSRGSKIAFTDSVGGVAPVPTQSVYAASKAALNMYARVLRIEMKPLGVQVVSVMTGEILTGMMEQNIEKMPDDSPYKPIEAQIQQTWAKRTHIMNAAEYAKYVVPRMAKSSSPNEIWAGGNSSVVYWTEVFKMQWIWPYAFSWQYGLNKLSLE